MGNPNRVSGVILAGGLARRMEHQDKGLITYKDRPLVSYAIAAMLPVVDKLMINANRNLVAYQQFGLPVVADQSGSFDGPLAGILTALAHADAEVLLVMPCDCPLVTAGHLRVLLDVRKMEDADIAVAFDGERLHPVFLAIKTSVRRGLEDYLASGWRKVEDWLLSCNTVKADFSKQPDVFVNINTMAELIRLEEQGR
ncbi:MAG: molybdenum cofactor guanylyltransferase MobA [Methylovulum sp.]|nr:molybdenum cofactor guanylyltransferase MobA [Methylovulum sp.]